jgi:two-component system LytT family response regulator
MLKAIIVDNEEPAIDILRLLLERTGQVRVTAGFLSAADALAGLQFSEPDIAFLDIEMPETNGLELAEKILALKGDVEIVFVTAYDQYALEAFRVNALDYLLKPLSVENVERTVARLQKRKGGSAAAHHQPLTSGRIYCFGKLSVYGAGSGQPVKWRTAKAEELFAYLLQHLEQEVPKWKICEALWPEYNAEKVDIHLHTTVYKMKKVLASANIQFNIRFSNGCYWMSLPQIYVDTVAFDSVADSGYSVEEGAIEKYEKAFSLYKNDYLEENDYIWSLPKREEYARKYHDLADFLVKRHMQRNDYAATERVLQRILEKFPFEESAHEMLLKVYFVKRDRAAFVAHYQAMQESFRAELGIEPSDTVQALYNRMLCG